MKPVKINDSRKESSPKILADSLNNFFVTNAENIDKKNYSYKCKLQGLPGKFSNQFILFKTKK